MSKNDIKNSINDCLRNYKLIYYSLDLHTDDNEYYFCYKGNKVISFFINNDEILFKDKVFNYNFTKKHLVEDFIKDCVNIGVNELKDSIPIINIVSDIKRYSNSIWSFKLDIENKAIAITLNYIIPYYDEYTKRVFETKFVYIENMFDENFHFVDYHKEVHEFLNEIIAPAMEDLINEVVSDYNLNHITSALCRKSEVDLLSTKEECECQNN
jgi:hypothetical protein